MKRIICYVAFCDWLLPLSMFSRFIHIVVCIHTTFLFFFLWLHNNPWCGYTTFYGLICPLMDIWVFPLWAISILVCCYKYSCTSFCVNMHFHFSWVYTYLRVQMLVYNNSVFDWGTARLFSKAAAPFCIPISNEKHFDFSTFSSILVIFELSDSSHPSWHKVVFHCDFDLHFPDY